MIQMWISNSINYKHELIDDNKWTINRTTYMHIYRHTEHGTEAWYGHQFIDSLVCFRFVDPEFLVDVRWRLRKLNRMEQQDSKLCHTIDVRMFTAVMLLCGYPVWNSQRFRLTAVSCQPCSMFNLDFARHSLLLVRCHTGKLQLCQSDGWNWQHLEHSLTMKLQPWAHQTSTGSDMMD